MAEAYKKLGQGTLTGAGTQDTLYTVPAATSAIVKHIRIVNYGATTVNVKLWHDGTTDTYLILPNTARTMHFGNEYRSVCRFSRPRPYEVCHLMLQRNRVAHFQEAVNLPELHQPSNHRDHRSNLRKYDLRLSIL